MANEVEIVVTADDRTNGFSGVNRSVDSVGNSLSQRFSRIGEVAGGMLVAGLTTRLAGWAADGFSWVWDGAQLFEDTQESLNKVNAVFGESSAAIEAFSANAAQNLGLSERAALDATGTFGNMFDQLEFGEQVGAAMSQQMVILAADFASFHNADITDVIEAQTAAFRGEYDALQQFVPTINAAAVEQKALELSGKEATAELTLQEKALATHTLMMEGAGKATGDFQDTIDSAANQQRIAAAETENLQAQIGEKLTPVTRKLTELKLELVTALADNVIPKMEEYAGIAADVLGPALEFITDNSEILIGIVAALGAVIAAVLVPAMVSLAASVIAATWPFVAIAVAVGGIAAALVWAYENVEPFREGVDRLAGILLSAAEAAWEFIEGIDWEQLRQDAQPVIDAVVAKFEELMAAVGEVINFIIDTIEDIDWEEIWSEVGPVLVAVGDFFVALWEEVIQPTLADIETGIRAFVDAVVAFWEEWGDDIMAVVDAIWPAVQTAVSEGLDIVQAYFEGFAAVLRGDWGALWDAVVEIFTSADGAMRAIAEGIAEALLAILSAAWDAITSAASSAFDELVSIVQGAVDAIISALSFTPSIDWGGLLSGLAGTVSSIAGEIGRIIDLVNSIPGTSSVASGASAIVSSATTGGGRATGSFGTGGSGSGGGTFFAGGGSLTSHFATLAERAAELVNFPDGQSILTVPPGGRVMSGQATAEALAGGGQTNVFYITVEGSVWSEGDLAAKISTVVATHLRRGSFDQLGGVA